jgi:hypothetical protein
VDCGLQSYRKIRWEWDAVELGRSRGLAQRLIYSQAPLETLYSDQIVIQVFRSLDLENVGGRAPP